MITAIVFDLGGVLFKEGKLEAAKKLSLEHKYQENIIIDLFTVSKSIDLRKGLITDEEFWQWAKTQLPESYDTNLIKQTWYEGYVLDEDIFSLIKQLQGKYKLIAFSDNEVNRVTFLDDKYDFEKYFDLEIYSYEYTFTKKDKEFYNILIEKSGNEPSELVYIDDNANVLQFTTQLVIQTLIYEGGKIDELKNKLRELGVEI